MDTNRDIIFGERDKITLIILKFFFDDATIHIDKFFSKARNDAITLKIFKQNSKIIKFRPIDQFKLMFEQILKIMKRRNLRN